MTNFRTEQGDEIGLSEARQQRQQESVKQKTGVAMNKGQIIEQTGPINAPAAVQLAALLRSARPPSLHPQGGQPCEARAHDSR